MLEFMKAGGVSAWVVSLFAIIALGTAIRFAIRPSKKGLSCFRAFSAATVFAVLSGLCANLAAVMTKIPNRPQWAASPEVHLIIMTGIGEALTVGILGFTVLGLCWFLAGIGQRRLTT